MLELRGVGYAYPGRDWLFRKVSFAVAPGTVTAVLGPNGRGKTTMARCAAGLLAPAEGTVARRAPAGFVPQARPSAFAYTVLDMVLMGRARHVGTFSVPGSADVAAAREAIRRVGVEVLTDRAYPTLSGGEQQLVLVARAVASGGDLLVLDEPANGLDLRNQGSIMALLRSLADDGMAVLLTSHHPDHALAVADDVVLVHGPYDVVTGRATDLLTETDLSKLYGVPVRCVEYGADGRLRRALVTPFDVDRDGGPADRPALSPARAPAPTPPPGR